MSPMHPGTSRAVQPDWRGLDRRTIAVRCGWLAGPLASTALTALATGGRLDTRALITLGAITVTFAVITLVGLVRWSRTRYRVTLDSLELSSGLFTRRYRAVPLHRIRNVDLTANPVQRLFGVVVLRAGTAGTGGELVLDALSRAAARNLRSELLAHVDHTGRPDPVLSTMDLRWTRYAPLTFWAFGGVFVVAGSLYRILDQIGVEPWRLGPVQRAFEEFGDRALWLTVPLAVLGIAIIGGVGATVLYIENWWRFRLEWTDADTLRVRRGLFTTRSVSIERRRLRGVLLREPLLLRAGGGATVKAVAGGLGNQEETRSRSALLPSAPCAEALRVTAGVLGAARSPLADPVLIAHPRVAFRRRMTRGMALVVLPVATVLAVLGALFAVVLVHLAAVFLAVAIPVTFWLARDAYRNLGHGVDERYLIARSGTFSRDTVALRRDGILSWTFSETPFTRRAGLTTLTAAVAAGQDGYRIPDLSADEAVGFAETVAPGILAEFLDRAPRAGATQYAPRVGA